MKNTLRFFLPLALLGGVAAWSAAQGGSAAKSGGKKRIIVCTVTTGFRHSSIPDAEKTIERLGAESGAFEVVDWARQPDVQIPRKPGEPRKPNALPADADAAAKAKHEAETRKYDEQRKRYEEELAKWDAGAEAAAKSKWDEQMKASMAKLDPKFLKEQRIDGVIFANTTGDLPLPDRDGFIQWVQDGHAFCAMHSGSDTFHGYRPYIDMLQGEFAGHGAQVPADLVRGDSGHPAVAHLPETWDLKQEEMYLIKSQERSKVRSLLFLRHHPNEPANKGFFPVSWCREFGKGKVFYTSLGHREDLWSDAEDLRDRKNPRETSKQYQQHILGGIKWALGLADGSAAPNPDVQ